MSIVFLTSNSHHQYLDKTTSKYFKILPIKSWIGIFKLYILITVNTVLPKAVEPKKKKKKSVMRKTEIKYKYLFKYHANLY